MLSPSGLPREGGASRSGAAGVGMGEERGQNSRPGRRLERGQSSKENEPIQSREGRGKPCLVFDKRRGRGAGVGAADSFLPSTASPAGPGWRAKERGCLRDSG